MKTQFIEYPKCSSCRNAKKWLENNKIEFKSRHIVEKCPSYEELKTWISQSKKEIKSFFNTSGLVYKSLNLKEKLPTMSDEEKIKLLSNNGMLIKRPIFVCDKGILVGFKENEWKNFFGKD